MSLLDGKTAIVTGSSSGIGRAIAEEFGTEGANVAVNYRSNERGAVAARDAIEDGGSKAVVLQADVSKWDDTRRLVERTEAEFGPVDVLVNNAGVFPRYSWDEMTREDWDAVLGVNLGGLFNMTKHVLPTMLERKSGSIVNLSSTWALIGGSDNAAYTATKGGIVAVTRQMCTEFAGDGIRVNALSPGATKTAMNEELREDDEYIGRVEDAVPAGRFGTPEDIAHVAVFLASEKAAYVNGQNIVVDGGLTA